MSRIRPLPSALWKEKRIHRFSTRLDAIRDLLVIDHPFAPSRSDGFAEWSVQTVPPSDWRPGRPLFLSFYQSDNYSGTTQQDAWTGTQAFIGHRFKQAMVDGHLVWESDVADEEMDDPRQQPEDGPRSRDTGSSTGLSILRPMPPPG